MSKSHGISSHENSSHGSSSPGSSPPGKAPQVCGVCVQSKRRDGHLSGSFALESPEKIRRIEEMDEELSFQFEDRELQREDEQREEEDAEEQREEEEAEQQREEDETPAHRPLKPSLPSQQGFTCSSCLSRNHFTTYSFLCLLWLQCLMIWESQLCHPL
jgi:hypothetical protein